MNYKQLFYSTLLICGVLFLSTVLRCSRIKSEYNTVNELYLRSNDTVKIYKRKNNTYASRISTLQADNTKQFLELSSSNKDIIKLQETVKEYQKQLKKGGTVIYVGGETVFDTIVIKETDFIVVDNKLFFEDSINNQWISSKFGVKADTTFFSLKTVNEYSIIIGQNRKLFRKPEYFTEIINHNPYSVSHTLRSVNFNNIKQKRFGLGFSSGLGLNTDFNFRPYVGISVNYNLINF